eukprot:357854-Chlamydomonas_euryale.AAC.3
MHMCVCMRVHMHRPASSSSCGCNARIGARRRRVLPPAPQWHRRCARGRRRRGASRVHCAAAGGCRGYCVPQAEIGRAAGGAWDCHTHGRTPGGARRHAAGGAAAVDWRGEPGRLDASRVARGRWQPARVQPRQATPGVGAAAALACSNPLHEPRELLDKARKLATDPDPWCFCKAHSHAFTRTELAETLWHGTHAAMDTPRSLHWTCCTLGHTGIGSAPSNSL